MGNVAGKLDLKYKELSKIQTYTCFRWIEGS